MSELATAYVQLVPTATGMKGKIEKELGAEADAAGKSAGATAGNSLGASLGSTIKKVVIGLGIGKVIKDSLDAGGALQQSFGGLETIYGEAAKQAKAYASEAVKAGISANDYAEQAVSFGASLKQAFGGDTVKAMESANTAILDMADNSAKMGTDIGMIQNAYQGFAKQNYTMLDNLKLGYGGTKTEMERLLADAEKLTGVKYDINNLGDVYEAIHAIQGELGLTGVAAAEAAGTFTGSFASMKAAAQNLLANLALGEDIQPSLMVLRQSVMGFLENNLLPMVGNILKSAPQALDGVMLMIHTLLDYIESNAGKWTTAGINLVGELAQGILSHIPYLAEAAIGIASEIINALLSYDWISGARGFISELSDNMELAAGEILGTDGAGVIHAIIEGITNTISDLLAQANVILKEFSGAVTSALPTIMKSGIDILTRLVDGILSRLPDIIRSAGEIINTMLDYIMKNLPAIMQGGMKILMSIVQGIAQNLPEIIKATMDVLLSLQQTIIEHLPEILEMGVKLVLEMVAGIIQATPDLVSAMLTLLEQGARQVTEIDWVDLGADIIKGIVRGIKSGGSAIWEAIKGYCEEAWSRTKAFFKIGSPSKLFEKEIGEMIPQGMAIGIEKDSGCVTRAMEDMAAETVNVSQNIPFYGKIQPQNSNTGALSIVNTFNINGANKDGKELAEEISYYLNADLQRTAGAWA